MNPGWASFTNAEAQEIAKLLELERDKARAAEWLDWLSWEVEFARSIVSNWRDTFAHARRQHMYKNTYKKRGRPEGLGAAGAVHAAAVAFMHCTGKRPTQSRGGPFYRLAQICTRLEDPGPLIAKLPRPFAGVPLYDMQPLPGAADDDL